MGNKQFVVASLPVNRYVKRGESTSSGGTWGSITGTLSSQTDLQTALNSKQDTLTGLTSTVTELNFTDGVTSPLQTQINGKVSKVGTPVDNQVGVWTGDGTLEGTTKLTFDNTLGKLVVGVPSSDTYLTISETSIIGGVPLTVDTTGNNLSISASEGNGTGNGGNIFISAGAGGATGVEGLIGLFRNTTAVTAYLDIASLTVDRTFTFPDATGTIALTSDITTGLTQPQLMARMSIGF